MKNLLLPAVKRMWTADAPASMSIDRVVNTSWCNSCGYHKEGKIKAHGTTHKGGIAYKHWVIWIGSMFFNLCDSCFDNLGQATGFTAPIIPIKGGK